MRTSRSLWARVFRSKSAFIAKIVLVLGVLNAQALAQEQEAPADAIAVPLPNENVNITTTGKDQCPAIDCDCDAFSSKDWQQKCLQSEQKIKVICAENGGKPTQYCGLQGPAASPVAVSQPTVDVPPTTPQSLKQHKRQVVMLLWSIRDDLDNVRYREERAFYGDALQVHKLMDQNIERLFLTQYKAAEGERQRTGNEEAQVLWRDYRLELLDVLKEFEAYGEVLWDKFKSAQTDKGQKAYRLLAMRILRSASQLSEQIASAYAGEGNKKEAATAWQRSARLAQNLLVKEQESLANPKHLAYYRYQTAGRWNRASYYWVESKDEAQAAATVEAAEAAILVRE